MATSMRRKKCGSEKCNRICLTVTLTLLTFTAVLGESPHLSRKVREVDLCQLNIKNYPNFNFKLIGPKTSDSTTGYT